MHFSAAATRHTAAEQAAGTGNSGGMRRLAERRISQFVRVVRLSQPTDSSLMLPASPGPHCRLRSSKESVMGVWQNSLLGAGSSSQAGTSPCVVSSAAATAAVHDVMKPGKLLSHAPRVDLHSTIGRVELIMGPMFAGKTTQLIQHARQAHAAGQQVLVLKSDKDMRYKADSLATHDGDHLPCMAVSHLLHVSQAQLQCVDVIAVDEGQFFPDLVEFIKLAADRLGKTVYVAGLDGDFKRQKFGQMLDLVPLADRVHKLHTRCYMLGCSQPAIFSMRKSAQTEQEVVGGADKYTAACRAHYLNVEDQQ